MYGENPYGYDPYQQNGRQSSSEDAGQGRPPASSYSRQGAASHLYEEGGYWVSGPPYDAAHNAPPVGNGRKPKKEKKHGSSKLVALVLTASLVAGMAGSGFTYGLLQSGAVATAEDDRRVVLQTVSPTSGSENVTYASVVEEVAAVASPSVVEVSTEYKSTHPFLGSYITSGAGSGVIISEDGYIITNDHVVSGSDAITVRTATGEVYEARLVGTDPQTDIAVLKVDASGLPATVFADSDVAVVGQTVVAIGNPLGTLGGTVTEGVISAKDREITIGGETMVLLQTSAAISPGNSGGGLFDKNGHLVGVVNAKSGEDNVEGIGFAIPSNTARAVAQDLIENGHVTGRPDLGVEIREISGVEVRYYGLTKSGVYVLSNADDGSLQAGDLLVRIDGVQVSTESEVKNVLSRYSAGDVVELEVERGGRTQSVSLTL